MKNHNLLLFYFVPWLALGAKTVLYLDGIGFGAAGVLVIGAAVLYMAGAGFLAFYWGKRKGLRFLMSGCVVQYAANTAAGRVLLGENLWQMELAAGVIYFVCGFWQVVLFFCGRREVEQKES